MAVKDANTVAQLWATRLAASAPQIEAGVNAVTQAPGAKAAAQVDVWIANTAAARDKYVRNTSAVTLQSWQNSMITKGIPRIAPGAQAAIAKSTAFYAQFLPFVENIAQQVRAMPKGNVEAGIARVTAQIRGNASFVYNKKPV